MVDESEGKSVEYDPEGGAHEHNDGKEKQADTAELQRGGESGGGAGGVVGAPADGTGVPGTVGQLGDPAQLGTTGDPGDAHGAGRSAGRGDADAGRRGAGETTGNAAGGSGNAAGDGAGGDGTSRTEGVMYPRNVGEVSDENRGDAGLYGTGTVPGGVGGVDRETLGEASLRGVGRQREGVPTLAGTGNGRDTEGVATAGGSGRGTGPGSGAENETVVGTQGDGTGRPIAPADETPGDRGNGPGVELEGRLNGPPGQEVADETEYRTGGGAGAEPGGTDHPGTGWAPDGVGGRRADGRLAQDLLQVGTTRPLGDRCGVETRRPGAPCEPPGYGEGDPPSGSGATPGTTGSAGTTPAHPRSVTGPGGE